MKSSAIKEVFILALLTMVIVFTLGIVFYDYIPSSKTVPQSIEYAADSAVTATLQEIKATEKYDGSTEESSEAGSLLKSYSIGTSDLKTYASKKAYESGKTDPFSDYTEETKNEGTNTTNSSNANSNTTTNNTSTNTTASAGTTNTTNASSGTLFEKPNSK